MPEQAGLLERLSEGERACLRLLAVGHDTKSLAQELGISVAAATERLRSARTKLGVTSSREAARLLAAQEGVPLKIWPTLSGADSVPGSDQVPTGRPTWFAGKKGALIVILATLAIGTLFFNSGLSGTASPAPHVVSTFPANGTAIPPGPFTLRVTFDRPMAPRGWSFVNVAQGRYPNCDGKPIQSPDRRSFTMQCQAIAGTSYAIGFNGGRFQNFRAADGQAAIPHLLRFSAR